MKNLIIIGAGGCGREVLQWAKDVNRHNQIWNIKGFLDDNKNALCGKKCDIEVISSVDEYVIQPEDVFACAIGNSIIRRLVMEKMRVKGANFVNLIHPTSFVTDSFTLGYGIILYPYSIISDNAVVSDGCIINMHSSVAHDSFVGAYTTVSAYCDITGNCKIGEEVFMGTSVKMAPGTKIGNKAFLCAGSIIMTRVKDGVKVMGNPAKKMAF